MVCKEVRERLSEYLDGVLPIEIKTRLDDHLSACTGCRQELDSLKALLSELHALPPAYPPDDFLRQLHERVTAERPWHQRLIRSLFLPLRFKIPIQIAGALTAAVLVFSILTFRQDERGRLVGPSVVQKLDAEREESRTVAGRPAPTEAPPASPRTGGAAEAERVQVEQKAGLRERFMADEAKETGAFSEPQKVLALTLKVPMNRLSLAKDKHSRGTPEAPEESLFHELKALATRHQGRMLAAVHGGKSGRLESVEIEIPASQYASFSEELGGLGDIEPSQSEPEKDEGSLKVKIKVILSEE